MLNKLSINLRMFTLILIPLALIIIVSYFALNGINQNHISLKNSDANFKSVRAATNIIQNVNTHYTRLLSNINAGYIFWTAGDKRTSKGIKEIKKSFNSFKKTVTPEEKNSDNYKILISQEERLLESYNKIRSIFKESETKETKKALDDYVIKKMFPFSNALTSNLKNIEEQKYLATVAQNKEAILLSEKTTKQVTLYVTGGMLATLFFGLLIMRSITKPTKKLTDVVYRLANGEFDARIDIKGTDEFSRLGTAFNNLLDDRSTSLAATETEHQELNQSVFKLLQAVAELSEKNLTIRAEVTEDATGPVADALNLLAEETASTLMKVRDVAAEVNSTSQSVNTHLMSVNKLAMREQEQAIETAEQMDKMLERLDKVASSAAETNTMAGLAKASTSKAHESVSGTLEGMSVIRETVQETGKRIKQLGERSQEISHVIDIINTIAERTTVLALNASMQAVAAGDAGRGFSVIADEIQRLAESSRESTGQISTLVRNIQQETNTTISTMDKTIEQVIDGSTRAEDAAERMKEVLETTTQLVQSVDQIAASSRQQVEISQNLKHKAQNILKSTQSTGQELLSLTGLSRNLADYAHQLVQSVNVFNLGNNESETTEKADA